MTTDATGPMASTCSFESSGRSHTTAVTPDIPVSSTTAATATRSRGMRTGRERTATRSWARIAYNLVSLRFGAMPDAIFAHPRLAPVYDAFDADRADLDAYLRIVDEFDARHVLDIGCGTGALATLLARSGRHVTGVDPAAASLDVAMSKPDAASVTWLQGDATTLPALSADIALMTGNVAQVFLDDDAWSATLQGIHDALRDGGHLVFETRRPQRRAWEEWVLDTEPVTRNVPGIGEVERRMEVTRVALPYVSFRYTYTFAADGFSVESDSTLRFRSRAEVEETLVTSGFTVIDVREAPDRPDGSTCSWRNARTDRQPAPTELCIPQRACRRGARCERSPSPRRRR